MMDDAQWSAPCGNPDCPHGGWHYGHGLNYYERKFDGEQQVSACSKRREAPSQDSTPTGEEK